MDTAMIMAELDAWVRQHGNGEYIPEADSRGAARSGLLPDYGIQQVRREIAAFVDVILATFGGKGEKVLEIGLGYFGSTHFLWRLLFNQVATIESNHGRFLTFGTNTREYYGRWVLDDGKSSLFGGFSNDTAIVERVYAHYPNGIDVLFIDADHSYRGVFSDWLLYAPLVRPGGIVAFHDLALDYDHDRGPKGFFADLEAGKVIQGPGQKLQRILFSRYHGIGFYIKK